MFTVMIPDEAHDIAQEDQMWVYLWYEIDNEKECKFGEKWIKKGTIPFDKIKNRVRESLGVRKDLYDEGKTPIIQVWNVSEYAKKHGRFGPQKRCDDLIRKNLPHRKGNTGEIHCCSPDELISLINKELTKHNTPLPILSLSTMQYKMLEEILGAFDYGHKIIMAELCPRFGKTVWAGSIIIEEKAPITIISSYVLTSFTSFEKDLSNFEQFKNLIQIDAKEEDWFEKVKEARKNNNQVVVYISLVNGSKRDNRIETLYNYFKEPILLIIDEADFGSHTEKQSNILIKNQRKNDKVILMTGTNADRAISSWNIDFYQNVIYPELIMMKNLNKIN